MKGMIERDHPVIENLMRTGYPTKEPPKSPVCPICQEHCSEVYIDKSLDIVGCDNCVTSTEPNLSETCDVCKTDCDTIYIDADGKTLGCPNCIEIQDAWQHDELYQPE